MIPDWQLPPGVDRGLWDYLHSTDMAANYDASMAVSALSELDIRFCVDRFHEPGRILDLGCGTGRLAAAFVNRGFEYTGIDLSLEMLAVARQRDAPNVRFIEGNLLDLPTLAPGPFDYAACLFSTFGMIRGDAERRKFLGLVHSALKPGGRFVLHVHNRRFLGLGWKRWNRRDQTMPQAYGGAPLTLTHFTRSEIVGMLKVAGFAVQEVMPVSIGGSLKRLWFANKLRAYGWMICSSLESGL